MNQASLAEELTVAVLIPTHNRPEQLARVLDSVHGSGASQVLVFDDASTLPVAVSDATLLRSERNVFLSEARQSLARASDADVLFFVDDDCVVGPGAIQAVRQAFADDPKLGMAGPVIAYLDEPDTIWCAGVHRGRWTGRTRFSGNGEPVASAVDLSRASEEFPAAFALRRECWRTTGGFDPVTFPMHMGEAAPALRALAGGWKVELVPSALVWHDMSRDESLARRLHVPSPARAFMVARDRVRFIRVQPASRLERLSRLFFWACLLCPVQALAVLLEPGTVLRVRVRKAYGYVRGTVVGLFTALPEPAMAGPGD